jgi:hypothetical protein
MGKDENLISVSGVLDEGPSVLLDEISITMEE